MMSAASRNTSGSGPALCQYCVISVVLARLALNGTGAALRKTLHQYQRRRSARSLVTQATFLDLTSQRGQNRNESETGKPL